MDLSKLPHSPGVYLLRHRVTGDTYVGSTTDIRMRVGSHCASCKRSRHTLRFRRLTEQHGINFEASVLELTEGKNGKAAEDRWIAELRPTLNGTGKGKRDPSKAMRREEDIVPFVGQMRRSDRLRLKLFCIKNFLVMEKLGVQWIMERLDLEEKAEKKSK